MTIPEHHTRYRKAWLKYRNLTQDVLLSPTDPEFREAARRLEHEMDQAQNYFTWDEFQEFKRTLSGFIDIWPDDVCLDCFEEEDVDWMKEGF